MVKKLGLVVGMFVLIAALSGLSYAANSIQLSVNGKIVVPDVAPEIKDGRTMVPIRWVAEALGAEVTWDQAKQKVSIDMEHDKGKVDLLEEQIARLEQGFRAETAEEAAEIWAKAVKNRNGAVQFAVLSPELKVQSRSHYERIHWVTGLSSPYVGEYAILEQESSDKDAIFYIEFQMKTSTGNAGLESATVKVAEIDGSWYITQILGGPLGIPNYVPEDLFTENKEVRALIDKMEIGLKQADVEQIFGDNYVEVYSAMDGRLIWQYDFTEDGYQFEGLSFDGGETFTDAVDGDGLEKGLMRMQLFINWSGTDRVSSYALYYKGDDGKIHNFRLYADGKISIK